MTVQDATTHPAPRPLRPAPCVANFIANEFVPPRSGNYIDDVSPSTEEVIAAIPDSDERDVDDAVQTAARAFPAWSRTSAAERSRLLLKVADCIEKHFDELADLEARDSGKPLTLARTLDIPRAIANFRFFATAILHQSSDAHVTDTTALNYTLRQPLGVVGPISPGPLPLYLRSWKTAPAIAAGNACVAKPSEMTPLTAHRLAELVVDAGVPPGVINIVHGLGGKAGRALTCHDSVAAISFTGGTVTGAAVAANAAPRFKKLSLELGGKNPTIVFGDADLDQALPTAIRASFWNQGEICLCGSRIFVEKSIYERFVDGFVERAKALRIGEDLGALISEAHLRKVLGYIDLAKKEGGTIATGGNRIDRRGYFVEPTVITGLGCDCRVLQEEIFGPVVTITPFDGEEEAVAFANSTKYGLSASLWTRDLQRAHRVAAAVDSGTVWINCWLLRDLRVPFGGMRESGVGREGGFASLEFFTEAKNVCVKL